MRRYTTWAGTLFGLVVISGLVTTSCKSLGVRPTGARLAKIEASPNYKDGRFRNELPTNDDVPTNAGGYGNLIDRMLLTTPEIRKPRHPMPIVRLTKAAFETLPKSGLRITWLGHSTVLVEIDGQTIITDPIWSERASPNGIIGPKRFHPPPLPMDELPKVDAVVISHSHYDHLDMDSVLALSKRGVRFFVPLGVGAHLEHWGIDEARIVELDWWQSASLGAITLVATPARHTSMRNMSDKDATLWASWAMVGSEHRVFFSGDTGMSPTFRTIGERLGPFDVTLVESGCYDRWWADLHLGPEQAVAVHRAVRGRLMLPIHWGTFQQAPHAWTEPPERVRVEARRTRTRVVFPRPGQSFEPATPPRVVRWWPRIPWSPAHETPVVSSGLVEAGGPSKVIGASP